MKKIILIGRLLTVLVRTGSKEERVFDRPRRWSQPQKHIMQPKRALTEWIKVPQFLTNRCVACFDIQAFRLKLIK